MPKRYVDVAFPAAVRRLFTYHFEEGEAVRPGVRLRVPLRRGESTGMAVRIHEHPPQFETRRVLEVLDEEPVLDGELLRLTEWVHRFYYCSWGEVIQAALPGGLERRPPAGREVRRWDWRVPPDGERLKNCLDREEGYKWLRALKVLARVGLPADEPLLLEEEEITRYTLQRIGKEGLIRSEMVEQKKPEREREGGQWRPGNLSTLSGEQRLAYNQVEEALERGGYSSFLLHGVTGSGKTEIYIHALRKALDSGRGGMVLVPEIALTPQTVGRFRHVFGETVAVVHSRLGDRERDEAWNNLRSGRCRVVIGPRSAVFAPVRNLGVILVDEEHDTSYKQFDPAPRYHARDVALMRASIAGAAIVLGSATPSLTSLRGAARGKHTLLELASRPTGRLPDVEVLDLRQYRSAMRGPLTIELYSAIEEALERKEQVILLYNRRGFASYLLCEACGHIPRSPSSSVTLTLHERAGRLVCHYSGYQRPVDRRCESCGSAELAAMGSGTQQVEDELAGLFPEARLLRMDRDTTTGKESHRRIYEQFRSGEADILIGTQLVSKGLDFPGVTVVGVLHAETELAFPSFRAGERMFQLLSQVAGRAGRGEKPGTVWLQTWRPDHRAIRYAAEHDFRSFAREEMAERKSLSYPPYSRMIVFHFRGRSESMTRNVAELMTSLVTKLPGAEAVLGPSPSVIERMNGLWQWECSMKIDPARNELRIERMLDRLLERFEEKKPPGSGGVRIAVDVDAVE